MEYILLKEYIMSDSQRQSDGFRSRDQQLKRRLEIRNKILSQFKKQHIKERDHSPPQKYVGLSHSLMVKKQESDEEEVDMFGEQVEQNKRGNDVLHHEEVTDESGYYHIYSNKIVGSGKYKIIQKIGKGMFGVIAKAVQTKVDGREVALKIIRKNQMMLMSGEREYKILSSLKKPEYIMKGYDYFHEDGHLFLVVQLMGSDLRSFTHKNQDKITLESIRQYGISMFMSLYELRKSKIIHADIKPDNFLFTQDMKKIKLSDFGTSFTVEEHSVEVDYLVARYYRAPEIILGCDMPVEQRYGIDTWAVGCSLYELFTGKFLFQGGSNNQMLKLMMETKGKFSVKMLKKCRNFDKYFDNQFNFLYDYYDSNTKQNTIKKLQTAITPDRELLNLLKKNCTFAQDIKTLINFKDFLEQCLVLNPKNRLTPEQAFQHPFLNYMIKLA